MPDKVTIAASERQAREDKKLLHAGLVLERSESQPNSQGVWLHQVKVKIPADMHGETMVVLTGGSAEGPVVAFHRGDGVPQTLAGAINRYHNGTLKWKEDQYAK